MSEYSAAINQQYGRSRLHDRILDAFKRQGFDTDALTLDDLAMFDQLHAGGRRATRKLANLADLKPGMEILDIGSGLGGPARLLAAEFGCQVTGIDLTEEYVKAAEVLTDKVGLDKSVRFFQGNALNLVCEDKTFDAVWSQNAIMNIEDKERVFQEVHRVLRSGGILALEALMAGDREATRFPVYWADTPAVSYISPPDSFRKLLEEIGFEELIWEDVTQESIALGHKYESVTSDTPPPIGFHIFIKDVPEKAKNTLRGYEDGTYLDIYAVYKRTE